MSLPLTSIRPIDSDLIAHSFKEITAITAQSAHSDHLLSKLKVVIQHGHGTKEPFPLKLEGQMAVNRIPT